MEGKGKLWNWLCWGKKGTWRNSQEINENGTRLQEKWLWWEVLGETKVGSHKLIMCNGLWTVVRKVRTWRNARWKSERKHGTVKYRKLKESKKKRLGESQYNLEEDEGSHCISLGMGNIAQGSWGQELIGKPEISFKIAHLKNKGLPQRIKAKHTVFFTLFIWQSFNFVRNN